MGEMTITADEQGGIMSGCYVDFDSKRSMCQVKLVTPGTPMAKAGVKVGWYIEEVSGVFMTEDKDDELAAYLENLQASANFVFLPNTNNEILAAEISAAEQDAIRDAKELFWVQQLTECNAIQFRVGDETYRVCYAKQQRGKNYKMYRKVPISEATHQAMYSKGASAASRTLQD